MPTNTPTLERRILAARLAPIRVESRAEGEGKTITGYGAVYYRADDPGTEYELWEGLFERIMPGAFDRAIKEDDVRGLFNHDPNQILGRNTAKTMRLTSDAKGLRYEIDPPDTQLGHDLLASIKRGDISGSSFSFVPDRVTWIEEGARMIRQIEAVRLWDTGPVTFPAYTATTAGTRTLHGRDLGREAEAVAVRRRLVEIEAEAGV
ncbi:MAG: HK97 family phage prohead protease [Pirellulales bacterium]